MIVLTYFCHNHGYIITDLFLSLTNRAMSPISSPVKAMMPTVSSLFNQKYLQQSNAMIISNNGSDTYDTMLEDTSDTSDIIDYTAYASSTSEDDKENYYPTSRQELGIFTPSLVRNNHSNDFTSYSCK